MIKNEDCTMVILLILSCGLHATRLCLVCLYPVGFLCANQGLHVPDLAVHVILPVGPARLNGLASGSC